jgi:ribose 1,5-bisphosphokinase PhnN
MTKDEFSALCDDIGASDEEVAKAMETHRTTIGRYRDGTRSIPGPVRVLARILAERGREEREEERRQVARSLKAVGK